MAVTAALADATYRTGTTSIASVPIGTAAAGRVVVAFCQSFDSNDNVLYNETIGGVAISTQDGIADACILATGTTATIASSGASSMACRGVYALSGSAAVRPTRIGFVVDTTGSFSSTLSIAIEVTAGSTVIAQSSNINGSTSGAFTSGVTSDGTFNNGAGTFYRVGHADQASGGTVTVTATNSGVLQVWVYDAVGPEWSFINASAPVLVASGNVTLTEPSGTAQNDVVVAGISYRSTAAFTNPASWSALAPQQSSGNTTNGSGGIPSGLLAGIVRGASAPSYAFMRTAGSIAQGRAYTYRSSTAGTPTLGTGSAATAGSSSSTVTTTGFTPASSKALLVSLFISGDTTDNFPQYVTAATSPTAWAQPDNYTDATSPGVNGVFSTAIQTTAGATGTFTGTSGATAGRSVLMVGQILPLSGGGTAYTLAGAEGAFSISGKIATTAAARHLSGVAGTFAISGKTAVLSHGLHLSGAEGSFAISGQSATINRGIKLGGVEGAFTILGQAATLTYTPGGVAYTLAGAEGSFAISGQNAAFSAARKLSGAEGSFSISGQAATLNRAIKMAGAEGAFLISGQPANELRGIKLSGGQGAFSISGQSAALSHQQRMAGAEGAFVISGKAASFASSLSLNGAAGAFLINGPGASLVYTPSGGGGQPPHSNPFFSPAGAMTAIS